MPDKMRAVDIHNGKGPITSLYINPSTPVPEPTKSQALIKIKAFGLNRMDLLQREGRYPVPAQAPSTLGVEFSGTIVSLPDSPTTSEKPEPEFQIGDEVFGLAYGGAYAEYIAASTHMLMHKPHELSWETAAAIPEVWTTATQALYLIGGYRPGESVLWHAGASSVSIAGIQLSRAEGARRIVVTAGSQEKIEFCKKLGATDGFNYRKNEPEWSKAVSEGGGVDVIIDPVGATYFSANLDAAARDAHIVCLGFMGGATLPEGVDISRLLTKRIRIEGTSLRSRDEEYQRRLRDTLVQRVLPRLRDGTFKVFVEKVFAMDEIQEAHRLLESNRTMGKVVCTV